MVTIQIPKELDAVLESSANRSGRTKYEVLRDAIVIHTEEEYAAQATFSDEQIRRFQHSIAQLDRGEVVSSDKVETFFEDWFKELDAR